MTVHAQRSAVRLASATVLAIAPMFSFLEPASAADMTPVTPTLAPAPTTVEQNGWTFTIAPYFWVAGLSGDTAQFGAPSVHLDFDFGDILKNLDFAAMAIGEARYDRYSIFTDIMYSKISSGVSTPRGILASDVDVTAKTFAGLIGGGYSFIDTGQAHVDAVLAARVWSVDTDISLNGGFLGGRSFSDGETWVDALGGLRASYSFTPKIFALGWGLVGGGGANVDWDVAGALGYRFNDRFSALLGYRALGVDYSKDSFEYDIVEQGPILGLSLHF